MASRQEGSVEPQAPPSDSPAIYDSIAVTYASYKNASEFKRFSEEPTFWAALGDPKGLVILDLACGTGHYSRNMHLKGAKRVVGVDVSKEQIAEARRLDESYGCASDQLAYVQAAASDTSAYVPALGQASCDVVTAQYLLPYAACLDELTAFCRCAYDVLAPNGRFVSITTACTTDLAPPSASNAPPTRSDVVGYEFSWDGGGALSDGTCVSLTLFDAHKTATVTFPNVLWSRGTIRETLLRVGFTRVEWHGAVCCEAGRQWFEAAKEQLGLVAYFTAWK